MISDHEETGKIAEENVSLQKRRHKIKRHACSLQRRSTKLWVLHMGNTRNEQVNNNKQRRKHWERNMYAKRENTPTRSKSRSATEALLGAHFLRSLPVLFREHNSNFAASNHRMIQVVLCFRSIPWFQKLNEPESSWLPTSPHKSRVSKSRAGAENFQ